MKHIKYLTFASALFCVSLSVAAQSPDGKDYEPVTCDGESFTVSCDWLNPSVFPSYSMDSKSTDFFIHSDRLYFNHVGDTEEQYFFHVVNANTGEYEGTVPIDWNGLPHSPYASQYVGVDSEGTPYVSSYSHGEYQNSGYPFTVTSLDFIEGKPVAQKVFTFPIEKSWWTMETAVSGSLNDGNFRLVVNLMADVSNNMQTSWGFAEWVVSNGVPEFKGASPVTFTLGSAMPVGGTNVLIYNCDLNLSAAKSEFTSPTLCTLLDNKSPEQIDLLTLENKSATGMDVALYQDRHFLVYGKAFGPTRYGVSLWKSYPEKLSTAEELWTLGESKYSNLSEDANSISTDHKVMTVHADKNTTDGVHFYTFTNHRGVARYTLRSNDIQTSIVELKDNNSVDEYYTLTGLKLTTKPTTPGIYIRHNGNKAEKFILK